MAPKTGARVETGPRSRGISAAPRVAKNEHPLEPSTEAGGVERSIGQLQPAGARHKRTDWLVLHQTPHRGLLVMTSANCLHVAGLGPRTWRRVRRQPPTPEASEPRTRRPWCCHVEAGKLRQPVPAIGDSLESFSEPPKNPEIDVWWRQTWRRGGGLPQGPPTRRVKVASDAAAPGRDRARGLARFD
ncbi:hypothetical protein PCL_11209 [Purpureocillium lilacinum]|uniref:Uncharacterized protein n=1 Tax=Purpureocillium lilacinum TaxID=33203 RepID=A0A2U3EDK1_PURLI|nr:hypothetical protein PCL_11209 [Purpureocillium lilacinum]